MCGRFVLKSSEEQLIEAFGIDRVLTRVSPRFNLAPTQDAYVVLEENAERLLTSMRWGLVPSWAKDLSFGHKTINARCESIAEKPSFRSAFHSRRCLVLADGYYEWRREGKKKTPMFIHAPDGRPLAFAGLWERWTGPVDGETQVVDSCTIVTTDANDSLRDIHDRMPVVLDPAGQVTWLDHHRFLRPLLDGLMRPYPNEGLIAYEVSTKVNKVQYEAPDCLDPAAPPAPPAQGSLFDF